MRPVPGQRGPGPGSAEPESFPLLRRRLPLCGLRAAALELDWLWLNGQGQVLSKHQAHWAAGPSPLASVKSFPGRVGCSPGQSSSGKEGGPFLGSGSLQGEGSRGELVPVPHPSFRIISSPQPSCQLQSRTTPRQAVGTRATSGFSSLACWLTPSKFPTLSRFPFLSPCPDLVAPLPYLSIIGTL